MTRFNITLDESISMVFWVLEHALGGEIFIPKIPSYKITELAEAIGPSCKREIIGIREGEKLHEEMITSSDSINTFDIGDYYAMIPGDYQPKVHFEKWVSILNLLMRDSPIVPIKMKNFFQKRN